MSHFSLMVLLESNGQDLNAALEAAMMPFECFEAHGAESQYVKDIDVTQQQRGEYEKCPEKDSISFIEYLKTYSDLPLISDEEIQRGSVPKWGYALLDSSGEVVRVVERKNPNSKWDGWQLGGRWSGMLIAKDGAKGVRGALGRHTPPHESGCYDALRKSDIDITAMRKRVVGRAAEEHSALEGAYTLDELTKIWGRWYSVEEYINLLEVSVINTFAYIKGVEWFEEEDDRDAWVKQMNDMFDALPDDAVVCIVDCHT